MKKVGKYHHSIQKIPYAQQLDNSVEIDKITGHA